MCSGDITPRITYPIVCVFWWYHTPYNIPHCVCVLVISHPVWHTPLCVCSGDITPRITYPIVCVFWWYHTLYNIPHCVCVLVISWKYMYIQVLAFSFIYIAIATFKITKTQCSISVLNRHVTEHVGKCGAIDSINQLSSHMEHFGVDRLPSCGRCHHIDLLPWIQVALPISHPSGNRQGQ